jgi:PAS domain S-box-containing protein
MSADTYSPHSPHARAAADCLAGGGRMGALMRAFDWSSTSLGPVDEWPQSLRTAVSIVLASGFPMMIVWGPDYIQLYNDAYRPVLGATKHPAALGQRACDCWPEIWDHVLGPMFGQVMAGGEPIWSEDLAFHLDRNGYLEETFFTFSYSAVRDESGRPGGVLVTCVETTERVLGERRLRTLRELAAHASSSASAEGACEAAAARLASNTEDVPFALLYLAERDGELRLAAGTGVDPAVAPARIGERDDLWNAARVAGSLAPEIVTGLAPRLGAVGPWPEPIDAAAVLPVAHAGQSPALGVLVAGISPRRAYDERYQDFLGLVAAQIATSVTNARAYEAERERAEALAQIDRAKTAFFSNVSHEFRTPLTLILAPAEDLLRERHGALTAGQRQQAEILRRNAHRLLHLVNALLDFSRLEAGRAQATYRRTDIAAFTRDIAGAFRSLIEHAGLRFDVSCDPVDAPVYVDRAMWEKVVHNLLSNAFKFTLEGAIAVSLHRRGDEVEMVVRDSGVGIPATELPRIFDRFHRVENTRARTHEGSGIGLALTQEIVRLHGGTIEVDSRPDAGSTFTVRIPLGTAHLPPERVATGDTAAIDAPRGAGPLVDEMARWLPEPFAAVPSPPERDHSHTAASQGERARVLIVDDNADMRAYLSELLAEWDVRTAVDGRAALAAATDTPPDLVVTDVMMPGLDGFELLAALRADPRTTAIPVLMLSARAGEEARVSGLAAGADDYLTKPFAGRELKARVASLLALARARREAELQKQHLHALFMQAPTPIVILRGPEHVVEFVNAATCEVWGRRESHVLGRPLLSALPELDGQVVRDLLDGVLRTGVPHVGRETPALVDRDGDGVPETLFFNFVYAPLRAADGTIEGVLVVAFDVTTEIQARREVERLRAAAEAANRTKDEFLAILGHELRNPLAPILTALQLMTLRGEAGAERERTVIDRQVRHLVRLVDDLLDVSRIARGKIELRRRAVEMADIVAAAVESTSPLIEERQHELHIRVPRHGLRVSGDATRLTQVLTNIISNAAKYTEPRGRITVAAERAGEQVVVRVRDSGIGIAPAMLPTIFDMFIQGRQALDRSQGGLGLGLTIVRSLVTLHGGTVEAVSEGLGLGTEFTVRLPALAEGTDEQPSMRASPAAAPRPQPSRVLVVDDNVDAARLLADALTELGYETRVAFDGPHALGEAASFAPEVALLDLGLPLMDGYEVARQLTALAPGAPPLLIALTGYGQGSDHERSAAAGFTRHVVKPVDVAELGTLVEQLLRERHRVS